MSRGTMLTVFCYDVCDDRRRRRVAEALERHAVRVQESVFEANLTRRQARVASAAAARELGPGDALRVYAVGEAGRERCEAIGAGAPLAERQNFWIA